MLQGSRGLGRRPSESPPGRRLLSVAPSARSRGGDRKGCDPADGTPAACLVAWRGAPERCPAGVAPLDIVRVAVRSWRCLRNNVKDGTPRRAPEVALFGVDPTHPGERQRGRGFRFLSRLRLREKRRLSRAPRGRDARTILAPGAHKLPDQGMPFLPVGEFLISATGKEQKAAQVPPTTNSRGADGVVRAEKERPAVLAAIHRESILPAGGSAGIGSARSSRARGRARRARVVRAEKERPAVLAAINRESVLPAGGSAGIGSARSSRARGRARRTRSTHVRSPVAPPKKNRRPMGGD